MKLSALLHLAIALQIACIGGCSSVTKTKVQSIELNKTTDADIRGMFGDPIDAKVQSGTYDSTITYKYVDSRVGGMWPASSIDYYCLLIETQNGKVDGFIYVCNNGENATRVDSAKTDFVIPGKTTRSELISLLGMPIGKATPQTRLEDYKNCNSPGTQETLVWADAPPNPYLFKPGITNIALFLVQLDKDGMVIGRKVQSYPLNFNSRRVSTRAEKSGSEDTSSTQVTPPPAPPGS